MSAGELRGLHLARYNGKSIAAKAMPVLAELRRVTHERDAALLRVESLVKELRIERERYAALAAKLRDKEGNR